MGVAYERCLTYYKAPHAHDRPIFVFPRGGASMEVTTKTGEVFRLGTDRGLVLPAGIDHDDRALASVYDTFALLPSTELVEAVTGCEASHAFADAVCFRRTAWLDALIDEYFIERVVEARATSQRSTHLEALLVFEVYEARDDDAPGPTPSREMALARVAGPESLVSRALSASSRRTSSRPST